MQLGSALMLTPEAGTSAPHRARLAVPGVTRLTRAFSGRTARGIVNRFMEEHDADAPQRLSPGPPLTSPLRAAARAAGDADAINLWAGQGHAAARARPAGELVRALAAEARLARTPGGPPRPPRPGGARRPGSAAGRARHSEHLVMQPPVGDDGVPESNRPRPARSVKRPPASSTITLAAA